MSLYIYECKFPSYTLTSNGLRCPRQLWKSLFLYKKNIYTITGMISWTVDGSCIVKKFHEVEIFQLKES